MNVCKLMISRIALLVGLAGVVGGCAATAAPLAQDRTTPQSYGAMARAARSDDPSTGAMRNERLANDKDDAAARADEIAASGSGAP